MELEKLLCKVTKPARYCGGELNMVKKDHDGKVRFALAFPDIYEVGMSHLGSRILYHIINNRDDALCERVFSVWPDMEEQMKQAGMPLFTLESRKPLAEFDMIGFTLQYEMSYPGVLKMLALAGIPFNSAERDENHPLIIGGGPCAFNPEPIAPFFDLFVIGDGEEVTNQLIDLFKNVKNQGGKKRDFLEAACAITGVYVPAFYDVAYNPDGTIASFQKNNPHAPDTIQKAVLQDIDSAPYPTAPIVPYLPIVHNRMVLEVFRGCTRGCRFCQAGFIYRPLRERKVETLVELAKQMNANTGYDEISLTSLSTGDYPQLQELINKLLEYCEPNHISLSLPSLRLGADLSGYAESAKKMRRAGLTVAPEAGSQKLRDAINKNVSEEDLFKTVSEALAYGWNGIKLYFMIGLPYETTEDVAAIAELARKVGYAARKGAASRERARVHVSVSSFVPKAFTPFQWSAQDPIEILDEKQRLLIQTAGRGVELNWHDAKTSFLEAVLARGDRRLAPAIARAVELGANLEGWQEHFRYTVWEQAFSDCAVDPAWYANRERALDEILPYDHIDAGVTKEYLIQELNKANACSTTEDCRNGCTGCGISAMGGCC